MSSSNDSPLKVLQIASAGMEFFLDQVRILEERGVECDTLYQGNFQKKGHVHGDWSIHEGFLRKIAGHNPLYYAIRGSMLYPRILESALTEEYDIVHVNSGVVAPLAVLQPERPLVMTFWGDDVLGNRLAGLQPKMTKFCATQSDHVIVRSQEMRDALPCDASIIPSGVDLSKFQPMNQTAAREAVGWESTGHHVIFPYHRGHTKKRFHVAERTVDKVNERLDETVRLQEVHDADHDEMSLYYNAADVLLLPSLREGSPNTVKEAMACNLPVVSTDVGDTRKRLEPVKNSYVCSTDSELVDALVSVLETGDRSDGREFVREVSLDRMADRILSIYDSLLEPERRPRKATV